SRSRTSAVGRRATPRETSLGARGATRFGAPGASASQAVLPQRSRVHSCAVYSVGAQPRRSRASQGGRARPTAVGELTRNPKGAARTVQCARPPRSSATASEHARFSAPGTTTCDRGAAARAITPAWLRPTFSRFAATSRRDRFAHHPNAPAATSVPTTTATTSPRLRGGRTGVGGMVLGRTEGGGIVVGRTEAAGVALGRTEARGIVVGRTEAGGTAVGRTEARGVAVGRTEAGGTAVGRPEARGTEADAGTLGGIAPTPG